MEKEKLELNKLLDRLQKEQNGFPKLGNDGHTHESDGLVYLSYPPQSRCKICGKFYR